MPIILTMHKERVKELFSGEIKFEARKLKPDLILPITVYIYESKKSGGSGKIVGECTLVKILETDAFSCMRRICDDVESCKERERLSLYSSTPIYELNKYAFNHKDIFFFEFADVLIYTEPKPITDYGIHFPPVSWMYVRKLKQG